MIVFLLSITFIYAYEINTSTNTKCIDPDGGINYKVKSSINVDSNIFTDTCNTPEILEEYYCARDKVISQKYRCAISCSDGACKDSLPSKQTIIQKSPVKDQQIANNTNTCKDTDNGIDFYTTGTATLYNINGQIIESSSDFCASDNILYEKYCKFSTAGSWSIEQLSYRCQCTNGRCLQKSNIENIENNQNKIQSSPKTTFLNKILSFLGLKPSTTGNVVKKTPSENNINLSWFLLLIFVIIALIYLRSIYNEPKKKSKKRK